jgi:FKBP-type peptidyl-prolyl cis-trans isomerase
VGTGAVATAGKNLEVHYVLSFPNGAVDQSSRTSGAVFSFKLGVGNVIEGWDEGVAGMKVGGRRQLIVPEHLAYKGQAGKPAGTLVFDVELKKVT